MNAFVFIGQFCDAVAAAAADVSVFRFRSFGNLTGQLRNDSCNFSFTGNAKVRRNIGIKNDSFCVFSAARESAGAALAFRQCFFNFADKRIFFHGELLICKCKDKAEHYADASQNNDCHDCNLSVIHNKYSNSFA